MGDIENMDVEMEVDYEAVERDLMDLLMDIARERGKT